MTEDQVLDEFRAAEALLEGHFILSSGLRSPRYLQCARVLMDPRRAARLAEALAATLPEGLDIQAVVSPAMGGVIVGHEMGRALGVPAMFLERPTGVFELRRGFALEPGTRVLMMEDVVTTGLSSREAIAAIAAAGGVVVAAGALVDRSNGAARFDVPFHPLIRLDVPSYAPDALPAELAAIPAIKPGEPGGGMSHLRLGLNIDHVATVRNARGSGYPDPVRAAFIAAEAGADGITAHLREDRRHITDDDIARLSEGLPIPLNLEMAATQEMLAIALRHRPHAACIVPEKREERTTEGGLDAAGQHNHLAPMVRELRGANIRVSLFIEPDPAQIEAAIRLGAPVVELHTGRYAELSGDAQTEELRRLANAAALAAKNGIEVHAGHGLTFDNVSAVAAIPQLAELNIGHFLIGEAIFEGLAPVVRRMRALMDAAR